MVSKNIKCASSFWTDYSSQRHNVFYAKGLHHQLAVHHENNIKGQRIGLLAIRIVPESVGCEHSSDDLLFGKEIIS